MFPVLLCHTTVNIRYQMVTCVTVTFFPCTWSWPSGLPKKLFSLFYHMGVIGKAPNWFVVIKWIGSHPILCPTLTKEKMRVCWAIRNTIENLYFFPLSNLRPPIASQTCQTKVGRILWLILCKEKEATGQEKSPSNDEKKNWQTSFAFLMTEILQQQVMELQNWNHIPGRRTRQLWICWLRGTIPVNFLIIIKIFRFCGEFMTDI